ncbi:protein of unknown function [Aquiflexum balticum DSM 16537]|uniref:DUF4249 domain-containing protein n=1 Tax=Aquiflexum balticum DSM 16537 TaxID=758820 RepID=A0A1W2H710_9BACT|nr:DUF4249 family protein [Aquiflexum balticum]SMD44703.1 protein of unknown function [Aquiflexum balticum DSM 16537]
MRNIIFYFFFLVFLSSCQEEVVLELKQLEPIPAIEAIWTNNPNVNQVRILLSKDYYDEEPNQVVEDAEVSITSLTSGKIVEFRFSEQANRYLALNNVTGVIGEQYELNVKIGDKEYVSRGTMLEPPILDSITYEFKEERFFREEGYYLTVYGKIPFVEENNYRIRIIKNDTLMNSRLDYLLFDDTFGTSILDQGFELSGIPFKLNDRIRLELYRMNRDAFDYISQLVDLLFNDGGLFSSPPQNPQSNIRLKSGKGEVLGYFLVSPFLNETVRIVEEDQSD